MEHYFMQNGDRLTIRMPKEIDHHIAGKLAEEVDLQIDGCGARRLLFDFSGTEFMDSSGIGFIIGRTRKVRFYGGEAEAAFLNERMKRMFQAAGLQQMVSIKED